MVAGRSNAYVCGRLTSGVAGSNPAENTQARLLCLLRVAWVSAFATGRSLVQRSLLGARVYLCAS